MSARDKLVQVAEHYAADARRMTNKAEELTNIIELVDEDGAEAILETMKLRGFVDANGAVIGFRSRNN